MTTLNEFQDSLQDVHVQRPDPLTYGVLGLLGEAGETAETYKKCLRRRPVEEIKLDPDMLVAMSDELGDVLWYVAKVARELGFTLEEIARGNMDKLARRRKDMVPGQMSFEFDRAKNKG